MEVAAAVAIVGSSIAVSAGVGFVAISAVIGMMTRKQLIASVPPNSRAQQP